MNNQTRNERAPKAFLARAALLAAGALVLSAPAAALDTPVPGSVREARVSYADLDLAWPEGLAALRSRVESAARAVCGNRVARTMKEIARARECYQHAVTEAMRQVEVPVAAELRWTVSMTR